MNSVTKKLIEDHINLIDTEDFEQLYSYCPSYDIVCELTEMLLSCDIDPLLNMTIVPTCYMKGSKTVNEIIIPDNIHVIGSEAFQSCPELKTVTLSSSLKQIGSHAFEESPIKSINLPESLLSIGPYSFSGTHLKTINIPDKITDIPHVCFFDCLNLESVTLGKSVKRIEQEAFSYCYKLESVTLNEGLEYISDGAFRACPSLKRIYIPQTVQDIAYSAFRNTPVTILCNKGSFAEEFATEIQQPYIIV